MKIAFDATLWDEPTTGIGLYTRCLVEALQARGVDVERIGARRSGERPRRTKGRTAYFLGELPGVLRESEAELFHAAANFNLPLTRIAGKKLVVTVHDLIPDLYPDTVSAPFRWQFRLWLARALAIADAVICVSHRTREDLVRRFEVDSERLHVVHNGVDHVERVVAPDRSAIDYLRGLALPSEFVLYAGALDARKNVALVLEAVRRLSSRGRPATLVLLGQRWFGSSPVERRIGELRAEGLDLRPLGYQPDEIFYEVIRRASAFVFPSRYEGFGLPPLEAMWLGVPTVISNAGSLPEVCSDAALKVEPDDAGGLASAIDLLLNSDSERARWGARGRQWSRQFTWARAAAQTAAVYERVLATR